MFMHVIRVYIIIKPISAPGHSGASYKGATTYVANGVGIY